jgi:hypothetical protein
LRRNKNLSAIKQRIRSAAFGRSAFPDTDLNCSLGGTAGVADLNLQRKRPSQSEYAVKAHAGIDQNIRGTNGRKKKDSGQKK